MPESDNLPETSHASQVKAERIRHIDALLATVPESTDHAGTLRDLLDLNRLYKQRVAVRLQAPINGVAHGMPQEETEQKKIVGDWVNAELAQYDLAVKCPKTGHATVLRGEVGNWKGKGRFQLYAIDPEVEKPRTFSTDDLPQFEITDATPLKDTGVAWENKLASRKIKRGAVR